MAGFAVLRQYSQALMDGAVDGRHAATKPFGRLASIFLIGFFRQHQNLSLY
jgi:hypothetical protein